MGSITNTSGERREPLGQISGRHNFEWNPGERFVSDGDPDTVTVPAALRDRLRSELPRRLRIVDR